MFTQLLETQRSTVSVLIFVGTFFAALIIGRLLKRRAGVRLGLLYQLFCLALASYAAIAFYGVQARFRNHVECRRYFAGQLFCGRDPQPLPLGGLLRKETPDADPALCFGRSRALECS